MTADVGAIAGSQRQILALLKQHGETTTAELAERLAISYEAVRLHIKQLEGNGLVERSKRPNPSGPGRPLRYYRLSADGEHLFPKNYDELAISLIDAIGGALGEGALRQVLAALSDTQARRWESRLAGMSLPERLEELKGIYIEGDPFTEVATDNGRLQLVERNCPYLNVAARRPALCSLTVSLLSRLLGHRVTRVRRFQDGDGRCVFHVHLDQPIDSDEFRFEPEADRSIVDESARPL